MLIHSRGVGQEIRIGESMTVVVQAVTAGRVRIGVLAPREISVVRGELSRPATDVLICGALEKHPKSPQ